MGLIKFKDRCKVLRVVGKDEVWEQELTETIYEGECNYQQGGQTALSVTVRDDVVFIPSLVVVRQNDIVEIESFLGEKFKGVVKKPRPMQFDTFSNSTTKVELKDVKLWT